MTTPENILVVLCTCPDPTTARNIARELLSTQLAACVNIIPGISSVYEWQGEVCEDDEVLLLIKTTATGFSALRDAILAAHPYELPEVIAVPVSAGLPGYLKWVEDTVNNA